MPPSPSKIRKEDLRNCFRFDIVLGSDANCERKGATVFQQIDISVIDKDKNAYARPWNSMARASFSVDTDGIGNEIEKSLAYE